MNIYNFYSLNNAEEGLKQISKKKVKDTIKLLYFYYESMGEFIRKRNKIPKILEWKKTYEAIALERSLGGEIISYFEMNERKSDFLKSIKDKQDTLELSINGRLKMIENYYKISEKEEGIDLRNFKYIGLETVNKLTPRYLSSKFHSYEQILINKVESQVQKMNNITDVVDNTIVNQFAKFNHIEETPNEYRSKFDLTLLKLCPCLTIENIYSLEEIVKQFVDWEDKHYSYKCFYEYNTNSSKNSEYLDLFSSDLKTIEGELLILRYGLLGNKKESLRTIRKILKIRSYKTLLMIMCNAFWKLKSRWPIELISGYLLGYRINKLGIYTLIEKDEY